MLSGRTFEPFEIHSCPGLVREFDRPHLQCFQRLQHLVTPWTLDTDEIAGLCNGSDRKIEGFSAAGCDDDLVGRACGSLPKHEPRHLPAQPDIPERLLICNCSVIKCGEREPHRSVKSRQRKKALANDCGSKLHRGGVNVVERRSNDGDRTAGRGGHFGFCAAHRRASDVKSRLRMSLNISLPLQPEITLDGRSDADGVLVPKLPNRWQPITDL